MHRRKSANREDLKLRVKSDRRCLKCQRKTSYELWSKKAGFHLDWVNFTHKLNYSDQVSTPKTVFCPERGLVFRFTVSGIHESTFAHYMTAIIYRKVATVTV